MANTQNAIREKCLNNFHIFCISNQKTQDSNGVPCACFCHKILDPEHPY